MVLGLQKSCKDSFYLPHRQFCLLLTSYIRAVRVLEQMSWHWYIVINQSLLFLKFSLVFTSFPFSVPMAHLGDHITFRCHVSLDSSGLWLSDILCF